MILTLKACGRKMYAAILTLTSNHNSKTPSVPPGNWLKGSAVWKTLPTGTVRRMMMMTMIMVTTMMIKVCKWRGVTRRVFR